MGLEYENKEVEPMKNKKIALLRLLQNFSFWKSNLRFIGILFLVIVNSCKSTPPLPQYQDEVPDMAATERETVPPDRAALDELETAVARAGAARQQAIDIDCPSIFPRDWESADALYTQTEQREKTSTLRETQESTARYYTIADAFEALNNKTLALFPENSAAPVLQEEESEESAIAARSSEIPPSWEQENRDAQVAAVTEVAAVTSITAVIDKVHIPIPEGRLAIPSWTIPAVPEERAAPPVFPARYTVRPWQVSRDSLRNIAGRSWVYNDPNKWTVLFSANKTKMPNSDNPNLIIPGMVLDIPSINGEIRQGMWDANRSYPTLK